MRFAEPDNWPEGFIIRNPGSIKDIYISLKMDMHSDTVHAVGVLTQTIVFVNESEGKVIERYGVVGDEVNSEAEALRERGHSAYRTLSAIRRAMRDYVHKPDIMVIPYERLKAIPYCYYWGNLLLSWDFDTNKAWQRTIDVAKKNGLDLEK